MRRMGWVASIEFRDGTRKRFFVAGDTQPKNDAKLRYDDPTSEKSTVAQTPNGQGWSEVPDDTCPADATLATVV
jgi:hypothetical protein